MTELEQYIQSYFGIIQSNDVKNVSAFFHFQTLKKGGFLLQDNQYCNTLSFIQSGFLRIFARTENKEVTQWISSKGYFITDLSSFIFETNARWNIQALVDTEIYTITKSDYKKLHEIVPKWAELENLFLAKCFTILEDRIFAHLSMTAEERYQVFFDQNKELFNQVPLQFIASMLGMTPETFSRIRKKQLL